MTDYKFFKDGKQVDHISDLYMNNNAMVDVWQVENGLAWTLEVFPENQSDESFNSGEFSGAIDMVTKEWTLDKYPDDWTADDVEELKTLIKEAVSDVTYTVDK